MNINEDENERDESEKDERSAGSAMSHADVEFCRTSNYSADANAHAMSNFALLATCCQHSERGRRGREGRGRERVQSDKSVPGAERGIMQR